MLSFLQIRGFGFVLAITLAALLIAAKPAAADEDPYCMPCQANRWKSVEKVMIQRAENLKKAREFLRAAERRGEPALTQRAREHLETVTGQWNEVYQSSLALGGPSYKAYLAKNLADVEVSYDDARAAWKNKVDQFRRLQSPIADQRERILNDMKGTIEEEANQRLRLGRDSLFASAKVWTIYADLEIDHLMRLPNGAVEHRAAIQLLNRLIGAEKAAETAKPAYELKKKHYWEFGAEVAQQVLETVVPVSSGLYPATVACKPIVEIGLDFASIGLSHNEWREAQERLEDVRGTELKWQVDLAILAARAKNLKRECEMAADAIDHQRAFEKQLRLVSAEVSL